MSNAILIGETLLKLKFAAKMIKSEDDLKATMHKYDMLFLGANFNNIYARELQHSLEKVFNKQISLPELLDVIPEVCKSLGMKFETMILANDPDRKLADYQITLF